MKNNGILCLYGNGLRSVKIDKHFSFKPKILNKHKIFTNIFCVHVFPEGIQFFCVSSVIENVFWSRKMWTKRIHLYTVQLKFCICFYCKSNSTYRKIEMKMLPDLLWINFNIHIRIRHHIRLYVWFNITPIPVGCLYFGVCVELFAGGIKFMEKW